MTLQPLLDAAPAVQSHAFSAMAAFALGMVQLAAPKGTLPHRTIGYVWAALMILICVTSFWIHDIRTWGSWSAIHLLSIFTLCTLPFAILHARGHRVLQHRNAMLSLFAGALLIAGFFTFWPGRIMHAVAFGN